MGKSTTSLLAEPTEKEITACFARAVDLGVSKHAVDEFYRQLERLPTDHELKWVGKYAPHQVVMFASLHVDGPPTSLVSICIPKLWKDVSLYFELVINHVKGARNGHAEGFKSLRAHDGDDSLWPHRDDDGMLVRNDNGHLVRSPLFRAKHKLIEPVDDCPWPNLSDGEQYGQGFNAERAMWHVNTFCRRPYEFIGGLPPQHFVVEPHAPKVQREGMTHERALEEKVAALEERIAETSPSSRSGYDTSGRWVGR